MLFFALFIFISSCAKLIVPDDKEKETDDVIIIPHLGGIESLEIMTWNIENFPKSGSRTIDRVAQVLDSIHADIYCLQEITDRNALDQVVAQLDGYRVIHDEDSYMIHLAIVYNSEFVYPTDTTLLFDRDDYYFASRPPLKVDFQSLTTDSIVYDFSVINLHMKCCGETSDIYRRHEASQLLHDYVVDEIARGDTNILILGDWNDDFTDPDSSGRTSFESLLLDPDVGHYATWNLANSSSNYYDSYPGWPSFIDHIYISNALFNEESNSQVKCLRLDDYFSDYDAILSDHRPVGIIFEPIP